MSSTSQQPSMKPTSTERDNTDTSSHEAEAVSRYDATQLSSLVQGNDQLLPDDDDFESEEEWEDKPSSDMDHRGKQDRPNVGAAQNATDGGKKKPVKRDS